MQTNIHELGRLGQSVWCDNLSRGLIESTAATPATASLRAMLEAGIVGVTSNPTIFLKAITGGRDYDGKIARLFAQGRDVMEVYEEVVLEDIADAADMLRGVYDRTEGLDGYVSLEVSPRLAYDTTGTIAEAKRLFHRLNRPNVLMKVPATPEGVPAVEALIAEGVNVNITLIFSLEAYERVMQTYLSGLRKRVKAGQAIDRIASVASFFVSRVDTLTDKLLRQSGSEKAASLVGRAAVSNAKLAYARFEEVFNVRRDFGQLAANGARVQRPLWASTSTKDPAYADTMYVDELIGPNTVNTMPPETIAAFLDHGRPRETVREGFKEAEIHFQRLAEVGVNIQQITEQLLAEGVAAFAQSFDELQAALGKKRREPGRETVRS